MISFLTHSVAEALWPYVDTIKFPYPTPVPPNASLADSRFVFTRPLRIFFNTQETLTLTNEGGQGKFLLQST